MPENSSNTLLDLARVEDMLFTRDDPKYAGYVNSFHLCSMVIGAVITMIGCSLDSGVAKFGDWCRRLRVWDYCGVTVVVCWKTPPAFGVFGAADSGEFGLVFWCG
ncbi:hypothetical protein Droror1_Dr00025395 [Drosera rotundifolia]